jgi:hypothetical protein
MKTQRALILGLSAFILILGGCATSSSPLNNSPRSPLQVRAMETRTYEGNDSRTTLKTLVDVLQDEGFLVDYAHSEMGLLHASKTIVGSASQNLRRSVPFIPFAWDGFFTTLDATVNVSNFGDGARVRISFHQKLSSDAGGLMAVTPVFDAKLYQEFFAKVDRGLFIQKQGL